MQGSGVKEYQDKKQRKKTTIIQKFTFFSLKNRRNKHFVHEFSLRSKYMFKNA